MNPLHCPRRRFLQTAGALALGAGLKPQLLWGRDTPAAPAKADVGIARGSSMADAVKKAVEMVGGMGFIKEGQTVLIKPNVTGALVSPTTTEPEVLYAVIKLVAAQGPKRIIVSDRSFSAQFVETAPKTIDVMERVGHVDAVNQAISDFKAPVVAVGLEDAAGEFEKLGVPWPRLRFGGRSSRKAQPTGPMASSWRSCSSASIT